MKITNTGTHCDFCVIGDPAVTYDLPEGFVLVASVEVQTGQASIQKTASGLICACEICARIIAGPVATRLDKLTRRIFRVNPTLKQLPPGVKAVARQAGKKIWGRWLKHLTNPHEFVKGEDPFEGLRAEYDPGAEGPGDQNLN